MRRLIKRIVNRTWKPLVVRYLKKTRSYFYKDISLTVPVGVFHPGFFFSTKLMILFLEKQKLSEKKFLEIGCGSGIISIYAAKQKAIVTTCDISPMAVGCAIENARINKVSIVVYQSDLFSEIPIQHFDIIAVNPPYYKKNPVSIAEKAWYAGENLEYFRRFFQQVKAYMNPNSILFMVLSDECDIDGIEAIANENNFQFDLSIEKRTFWEKNSIFNIRLK